MFGDDSPFERCNPEIFERLGKVICRQYPQFSRDDAHASGLSGDCPKCYEDVTREVTSRQEDPCMIMYGDGRRNIQFCYSLDVPSDREPPYQFFGRKRLLMRVPVRDHEQPIVCPGDTVETTESVMKIPKRYLLANYDPVPFAPKDNGCSASVQFVVYEMDQDALWIRRSTTTDQFTGLQVQDQDVVDDKEFGVIPITLESLYEERDRSLATKEDRRRVITGAPLQGNDCIRLACSSDEGGDSIEMRIIRVEFIAGVYVCEAI